MYVTKLFTILLICLAVFQTFECKEEDSDSYTVFHQVQDMLNMIDSFDETALCNLDTSDFDNAYSDERWKDRFDKTLWILKQLLCTT